VVEKPSSTFRAWLYRTTLIYWLLWGIPWILQQFARLTETPGLGAKLYWPFWNPLTRWFGGTLLGFAEPPEFSVEASGDAPFYWTLAIVNILAAAALATIWSFTRLQAHDTPKLRSIVTAGLRVLLGVILIEYGAAKVIPTQFPTPRLEVLATPLGELQPLVLLWAFMGVSPIYNAFAGFIEMLAGIMLFFRRTAILGAILGVAAIANVFLLNMGYDIPVKLFSIHLILLGIWLVAPTIPALIRTLSSAKQARGITSRAATGAMLILMIVVSVVSLRANVRGRVTYGDLAPKPPLHGIYRVKEIASSDGDVPSAWQFAVLIVPTHRGPAQVWLPDGNKHRYRLNIDTVARQILVRSANASSNPNTSPAADTLQYFSTNEDVQVTGVVAGRRVHAHLARVIADTLPVFGHGLRWIQ
jgi:hypothetical protein